MESLVPAPVRGTLAHGAETEAAVKSSVQINSHNIAATKPHKAVCKDNAPECDSWAGEGFCVAERTRRQRHMKKTLERICRKSCGFCTEDEASSSEVVHSAAIAHSSCHCTLSCHCMAVCVCLSTLAFLPVYLCFCASACVCASAFVCF